MRMKTLSVPGALCAALVLVGGAVPAVASDDAVIKADEAAEAEAAAAEAVAEEQAAKVKEAEEVQMEDVRGEPEHEVEVSGEE